MSLLPLPLATLLTRPVTHLLRWPVESQARARRNALVANTLLTDRRLEREEVERFLGSLTSGRISA